MSKYVLHVVPSTTQKAQDALFNYGFSWPGKVQEHKYLGFYALVINTNTMTINQDTRVNTTKYTNVDVDVLVKESKLQTTSGSVIIEKKSVENTKTNKLVEACNQPAVVDTTTQTNKYIYNGGLVELVAHHGDRAWITATYNLEPLSKNSVVEFSSLKPYTGEDAVDYDIGRIISNHNSTHKSKVDSITAYFKKHYSVENSSEVHNKEESFILSALAEKALKYIKSHYRPGDTVSRIILVNGLFFTKKEATDALIELEAAWLIDKKHSLSSRSYYTVK